MVIELTRFWAGYVYGIATCLVVLLVVLAVIDIHIAFKDKIG